MIREVVLKAADEALTKVLEQEEWSLGEDDSCLYRSPKGSCFIGHMIKDEHYRESLETNVASYIEVARAVANSLGLVEGLSREEIGFLDDIQGIHDIVTNSDKAKHGNAILTKDYNNVTKIYR